MGLVILGMGTAVPKHYILQSEARDAATVLAKCTAEQASSLTVLYHQTDIAGRHMVIGRDVLGDVLDGTRDSNSPFVPGYSGELGPDTAQRMRVYQDEALPMALEACRRAIAESGSAVAELTHLVTVSCTGFAAPGFDIGLIKSLSLCPTVERTHIGFMGCHGALNGLRVARALVDADPKARVLLCAAELCSIHYHYPWNPKRMVGNALFGDGAAALVGTISGRETAERDSGRSMWEGAAVANGSCLFPDSENALTWSIGNHGFDMTLSTRVPNLIAAHLPSWLVRWLNIHDLTIEEIASWAIHPGGPRVLSAVQDALGLARGTIAASREVLCQYGNMSSPTILFILERLRKSGASLPCVALGFGPGMVAEAVLFN